MKSRNQVSFIWHKEDYQTMGNFYPMEDLHRLNVASEQNVNEIEVDEYNVRGEPVSLVTLFDRCNRSLF